MNSVQIFPVKIMWIILLWVCGADQVQVVGPEMGIKIVDVGGVSQSSGYAPVNRRSGKDRGIVGIIKAVAVQPLDGDGHRSSALGESDDFSRQGTEHGIGKADIVLTGNGEIHAHRKTVRPVSQTSGSVII